MIGLLLAMYPAQWRRRYGEEFRAVLESRQLGPFDVADVLLGALDARSRAFRFAGSADSTGGRFTMLRLGGLGAVIGGLLAAVGFIGGNVMRDEGVAPLFFGLMALGNLGLLLALVGLSAFQARTNPRLAWAAFVIPAVGSLMTVVGVYGMVTSSSDAPLVLGRSPWEIWALGLVATLAGSILFGVATLRANVLSRQAATALAVSSAALLIVGLGLTGDAPAPGPSLAAIAAVAAFGLSWVWLGLTAVRSGPIRAVAPA